MHLSLWMWKKKQKMELQKENVCIAKEKLDVRYFCKTGVKWEFLK